MGIFKEYDIDTEGLKVVPNANTTRFYHTFTSDDRQERVVDGDVLEGLIIDVDDIPERYYCAKNIHIATNYPEVQLQLIKKIREKSSAIISIDTIEHYHKDPLLKEVFNLVDIAFIDVEFTNLLNCKAPMF